jgi:predicted dehydrogenase
VKQVFLSGKGQIEVLDVPVPNRLHHSVLVRNAYSLISPGTEGAAVTAHGGWLGVYEKAVASKARAHQVWDLVQTQGVQPTWEAVRQKLDHYTMIGYSCAGQVVEVDHDELPFQVGQYVAGMGTGFANHAEYVCVPKNLLVPLPDGIPLEAAAFAALGCIALQGIRRLDLPPGERIGVLGLGLIGQLSVRLLLAMGYQVVGIDLSPERAQKAAEVEGITAWALDEIDSIRHVMDLTQGHGLDGVLMCAATPRNEPINLAFDLCRQRGRVAVIGDVGVGLNRGKMYQKELELRLSCSYGPGRYDHNYEIAGYDYPFGYVRWTEHRNLEYFLALLASGRLCIQSLISVRYPIEQAPTAYHLIKQAAPDTYGVLLDHGMPMAVITSPTSATRTIRTLATARRSIPNQIGIGIIGAGGYAQSVHLPNMQKLHDSFFIHGVASQTGGTAAVAAKRYGISMVTSDYRELLAKKEIDAVIIATRHASHAQIVLDALQAGKHVFVEKPMATRIEDAKRISTKVDETGLIVRVGFNRRFSPFMQAMQKAIGSHGCRMLSVRVNIGGLDHGWSNTPEEGGRLLGEGVHFFDLCNWFIGSEPQTVSAFITGREERTNPNAMIQIRYPCGSTAHVAYTALGHTRMGKEYFEAFGNGRSVRSDDYQTFQSYGAAETVKRRARRDKGQVRILEEFAAAIQDKPYPVRGATARDGLITTWMALAAYESAAQGTHLALPV